MKLGFVKSHLDILVFQRNSSPKNLNSVIVYLVSCNSKRYVFPVIFQFGKEQLGYYSNNHFLCFTQINLNLKHDDEYMMKD